MGGLQEDKRRWSWHNSVTIATVVVLVIGVAVAFWPRGPKELIPSPITDPGLFECSGPFVTLYLRTQAGNLNDLQDSLGMVDRLLAGAVEQPVLFTYQPWIAETRVWLLDIQAFQRKVETVVVPPPMKSFHDDLTSTAEAYVLFVDAIVLGLDNADADPRVRAALWREEAQIRGDRASVSMLTACPGDG